MYIVLPKVTYRASVAECIRLSSTNAPKAAEFGEKRHFAFQGHSRSPILVPIESSYTTSY